MGRSVVHEYIDADTNELVLGIKAGNGRLVTARLTANEAWLLGRGLKENSLRLRDMERKYPVDADA